MISVQLSLGNEVNGSNASLRSLPAGGLLSGRVHPLAQAVSKQQCVRSGVYVTRARVYAGEFVLFCRDRRKPETPHKNLAWERGWLVQALAVQPHPRTILAGRGPTSKKTSRRLTSCGQLKMHSYSYLYGPLIFYS